MNKLFSIKPDSEVWYKQQCFIVVAYIDLDTLLVKSKETGNKQHLNISKVSFEPENNNEAASYLELSDISEESWAIAKTRLEIITPLLQSGRTKQQVEVVAKEHKVNTSTLYRWIQSYSESELLSSLLPQKRGIKKGHVKLTEAQKSIIELTIEDTYLTKQKRSVRDAYTKLCIRCKNSGVDIPHENTFRKWIKKLDPQNTVKRREGHKKFKQEFHLDRGGFPGADYPLSVVQIDHTPLDIIVVDEIDRLPIGRPWLTMAIDVFSRMVTGFYISMDPPSSASVGLCLSHSVIPKDTYLSSLDVSSSWPLWGLPQIVHADNAKEFRGKMLQKACEQYGIDLQWRPVATPHYGGHIERLLGTFAKEIHALPGSTFSNHNQKGDYDSDKQSALSLPELEQWLTNLVVDVYHNKFHSSISCSPLKKFEEGILGCGEKPGVGLPDRIADETKFKLDFMPFVERTVQQYGISIDNIVYNSDVLRCWVNAKEPSNDKAKRKFIIRRDPRNISVVYFYDPELKEYFDIPYSNPVRPVISLWELREVKRKLVADGIAGIDEDLIFSTYERLHQMVEQSVKKTQKVRRQAYRAKNKPENIMKTSQVTESKSSKSDEEKADVVSDVTPFNDLEIL